MQEPDHLRHLCVVVDGRKMQRLQSHPVEEGESKWRVRVGVRTVDSGLRRKERRSACTWKVDKALTGSVC